MTDRPPWLRSVDVEILLGFKRTQPEYIPLVANRRGIHLPYAERRCALLTEHALIEPVSKESVYQLTDHGEAVLTKVHNDDE